MGSMCGRDDRDDRRFARKCRTMFGLKRMPWKFFGLDILNYVDKANREIICEPGEIFSR